MRIEIRGRRIGRAERVRPGVGRTWMESSSGTAREAAPAMLADLIVMVVLVVMEYKFLHHSKIHPLLQVISQIQLHSKEVVV